MTDSNFNLTTEQVESIMDNLTYSLDNEQYKKLERFTILYDSLKNLLETFDSSDSQICSVVSLLNYFNESFFEFVESIESNAIK